MPTAVCLFVCLSVCLFVLHCITSQLCFLSFMSSLDLQQNEETLRHGSKHLYLFSVSQGKKLKFSMQFFSLQTCPIMPNPKQVLLCPKKPMSSSRPQQTSSQRLHTPQHTAPTLLTLLAELGGWRSVRRHHNELNRQGHRAWHMAAVQWLCAVQSRECRDMYNNVQNNS